MCEIRSRKKTVKNKKKKSIVVSSKKKWTEMNPIQRRMKKCNPSSEQNDQLVHWWLLVQSGQGDQEQGHSGNEGLAQVHHQHHLSGL
jgi:hypothetical protein